MGIYVYLLHLIQQIIHILMYWHIFSYIFHFQDFASRQCLHTFDSHVNQVSTLQYNIKLRSKQLNLSNHIKIIIEYLVVKSTCTTSPVSTRNKYLTQCRHICLLCGYDYRFGALHIIQQVPCSPASAMTVHCAFTTLNNNPDTQSLKFNICSNFNS